LHLAGTAEALREIVDAQRPAHWDADMRKWVAVARTQMGEERATICWAEGRARTLEATIGEVLAERRAPQRKEQ
jgi:hypothetical protein